MEKKQNVPALRFQGFSGEWEKTTVGKIFEVTRGETLAAPKTSPTQNPVMNYPVYSSQTKNNGLMGYYSEYLFENAITWTTDGANAGTVRFRKGKFYCTNVCGVLLSKQGYANTFMAEALNKVVWKHVSKVGNPKLMNNVMKEISIHAPKTIDEQNELAEYIEKLDLNIFNRMQKIRKLQQFRQAMLAKLFPREGAAEPELRFRGFSGKWKLRRLSDFVKEVTRVDASSHAPVMMITAANGFINQSERYSFDNSGQSLQKYILLKQGELAYNHGASKLRPFGSCFVLREKEARVPFVYHCFSVTDNYADFVALELNGNFVERQLRRIVSSSARMDGLLNISFEEYCTVKIALPCQEEQRKIGNFFRNLDTYISLQQKKLERMQRLKAALLEKLFV